MKRLLIALTFAATVALGMSGPAYADCTMSTYLIGSKVVYCQTCCTDTGNCSTVCR